MSATEIQLWVVIGLLFQIALNQTGSHKDLGFILCWLIALVFVAGVQKWT